MKAVPKKKQTEPPDEQTKRFVAEAQRLIDAGELNPIEADERLNSLVRRFEVVCEEEHKSVSETHQ